MTPVPPPPAPKKGGLLPKIVLILWLVGLVPWLVMAPLSLMAFDAGVTNKAIAFVVSVWSYPVPVILMAIFYRKSHKVVLLPLISCAIFAGALLM